MFLNYSGIHITLYLPLISDTQEINSNGSHFNREYGRDSSMFYLRFPSPS